MSIVKEKNYYIYTTNKGIYKFDINTCTFIGLKNKPIKTIPTGFKTEFKKMCDNKGWNNMRNTEYFMDSIFRRLTDSEYWDIINEKSIPYFRVLDRLDSLNIKCRTTRRKTLDLIIKYFNQLIKECQENNISISYMACELEKRNFLNTIPVDDNEILELVWLCYSNYSFSLESCKLIASLIKHNPHDFAMFKKYNIANETLYASFDSYTLVRTLDFFINTAKTIGYEIDRKGRFSKQFFEVQEGYKIYSQDIKNDLRKQVYAPKLNALSFNDDNFEVFIPNSKEDFIDEANQQHNCVFRTYYPDVVSGKLFIVFIRRKDNPTHSYITCEIRNGRIQQYLKACNNADMDALDKKFYRAYSKHLIENW